MIYNNQNKYNNQIHKNQNIKVFNFHNNKDLTMKIIIKVYLIEN